VDALSDFSIDYQTGVLFFIPEVEQGWRFLLGDFW
jgi:hypothetical protein